MNIKELNKSFFQDIKVHMFFSLLAFLPFLLSRIDYQTTNMNIITFLISSLSLLYFLVLYYLNISIREKISKIIISNRKYFFILVVGIFLTVILEVFNMSGLKDLFAFFQLLYISFSFLFSISVIFSLQNSKTVIRFLIKCILLSGVIFSFFSIINSILPNHIVQVGEKYYMVTDFVFGISLRQEVMGLKPHTRYSSVFSNPNNFGFYMFICATILIPFFHNKIASKKYSFKTCIIALLIFIGLIRSGSRTSILTFILFIIVYMLLFLNFQIIVDYFKKNWRKIVPLLLFITGLLVWVLVSRGLKSSSGRVELWLKGIDVFKNNVVTGIGTFGFREFCRENGMPHIHNSYLQLLASGGILYLSLYCYVQIVLIKKLIYMKKIYTDSGRYLFALIISLAFYQIFENTVLIIHPQMAIIMIFILISSNVEIID